MRWTKPNLKSIYGLLGHSPLLAEPATDADTDAVRQVMLDAIHGNNLAERHPQLHSRVTHAPSIHALWYARCDLMTALASELGEAVAQSHMAVISHRFVGLVPEARGPRPTRRGH